MAAFAQRGRIEGPASIAACDNGAQKGAVIREGDGAARFGSALQQRRGVIGRAAGSDGRQGRAVVAAGADIGERRSDSIDGEGNRRGGAAGIACGIGNRRRQAVLAIRQHR